LQQRATSGSEFLGCGEQTLIIAEEGWIQDGVDTGQRNHDVVKE
jgi:hypothetical protein